MHRKKLYIAICVVNDYKHDSYLTIDYLEYGFIMNKSPLLEKKEPSFGGPFVFTSTI